MISKGDNGTGTEAPPPKPLSFSISRILGQTDTHRATTTTTEHARTSFVLADEERQYPDDSFSRASVLSRDGDYRVPQLHASTVHHFAPYAHTDGYSHFESTVRPRACSTPENEYPSPTPSHLHAPIRPLPVSMRSARPSPYTIPTRYPAMTQPRLFPSPSDFSGAKYSSADVRKDRDTSVDSHTADFDGKFTFAQPRINTDGNESNRSTPEPDVNVTMAGHSDKSLDSLGESYHQSPSPFKTKKKKTRTVFSRNQIYQLEAAFDLKRYLSSTERTGLAASLNLSETQIKIWFQNRRNKWKRQINGEMDEIPIPPAFAAGYLQTTHSQHPLAAYGHMADARAELFRSSLTLPAYYSHPYAREKTSPFM